VGHAAAEAARDLHRSWPPLKEEEERRRAAANSKGEFSKKPPHLTWSGGLSPV
jgi:hypothetical protein